MRAASKRDALQIYPVAQTMPIGRLRRSAAWRSDSALSCAANSPYNRTEAVCRRPDGIDLSCAMLAGNYVARLDREGEGEEIECPALG